MPFFSETKYAHNIGWDFGVRNLTSIVRVDDGSMKLAALENGSESLHYATTQLKPQPNRTYIIVIAMGASDSYGPNRNADGFRRSMLTRCHPTFEDYANVFVNHKNKDPSAAVGEIIRSFFNDKMDRVELLLSLFNDKAGRYVQRIHDGRVVPVSMGLHIPGDTCSVCGHFAPVIPKHCKHMRRNGPFGPSTIYYVSDDRLREHPEKDGTLIHVDNPSGRFFDLSLVPRPADMIANPIYWPSAFMKNDAEPEKLAAYLISQGYDDAYVVQQMKLAEEGRYADMESKSCTPIKAKDRDIRVKDPAKLADMIKRIDGIAGGLDVFKKDEEFMGQKQAEVLVRGGISALSDALYRTDMAVTYPEVYKLAHMALYSSDVTDADIKQASLYQAEFVDTMHRSPAVRAYINTALGLDAPADTRHVNYIRGMGRDGLAKKLASAEHNTTTPKQKAMCGFVAANIFLNQKVAAEQLFRGRAISSDLSGKKPVSASGAQTVELHENPATALNDISTSFGHVIF